MALRKRLAMGAIAVMALTGCGVPQEDLESPVVEQSRDEKFLSAVEAYATDEFLAERTDDELISIGKAVCRDLGTGISFEDYIGEIARQTSGHIDSIDTGIIIAAGIEYYCPVYIDDLNAWRDYTGKVVSQ